MAKPVDFDELYPGRFLKAGLLDGKPTYEITAVDIEDVEGDTGMKTKGVLSFRGEKMQLLMNKTNGICLREMFGRAVQGWVGKRITLFAGEYSGEPCIRVWGSPDITTDQKIVIALSRKKPMAMTMHATGSKPAAKPAPAPAAKPAAMSAGAAKHMQNMADASQIAHLDTIEEELTEDNTLSPEETSLLVRALTKRRGQLEAKP